FAFKECKVHGGRPLESHVARIAGWRGVPQIIISRNAHDETSARDVTGRIVRHVLYGIGFNGNSATRHRIRNPDIVACRGRGGRCCPTNLATTVASRLDWIDRKSAGSMSIESPRR